MYIVTGIYRYRPRRLAFRNDFCLRCNAYRVSFQQRAFEVFHLYWIPLLPLGFRERWYCTMCGYEPHVNVKTRRPFKWIGLVLLILTGVLFWLEPVDPDMRIFMWICRIAAPPGAALLLWHLLRGKKDPSLKARLAVLLPASDTICPFCHAELAVVSGRCQCPSCGVLRV